MNVFILATCRKPELLPMTVLVFDTIKTGFPTADLTVCVNDLASEELGIVCHKCDEIGAVVRSVKTIHHEWIAELVQQENDPFWIVDTDVIFYESIEQFQVTGPLAGWRIPEWNDSFSGSITRARLHTSLLYIDPCAVRSALEVAASHVPNTPFTPIANLIFPLVIPFKKRWYFYDTCSMLYHTIGGEAFSTAQKECYFHMNFGTIPDVVLPRLNPQEAAGLQACREAILKNPTLGRGQWRAQESYYASKQVQNP